MNTQKTAKKTAKKYQKLEKRGGFESQKFFNCQRWDQRRECILICVNRGGGGIIKTQIMITINPNSSSYIACQTH
jgi:hypothetical protein